MTGRHTSTSPRSPSVRSAALLGVGGNPVTVEAFATDGPPAFTLVGVPDAWCREPRDRIRAALLSSRAAWPNRRISVTVTPQPQRLGSELDLAIALAVLACTDQIPPASVTGLAAIGELGLDGSIRRVRGVVPLVEALSGRMVLLPESCRIEAELVSPLITWAPSLEVVIASLRGLIPWPNVLGAQWQGTRGRRAVDLGSVKLSAWTRRAIEIAAAGGHHILLVGDRNSGASVLARCIADVLPPLDVAAALQTSRVYSAAGAPMQPGGVRRAPLRSPHHSTSLVALLGGGGAALAPGELSLAHNGVLFLDEIASFSLPALHAIRDAIDCGSIRISRGGATVMLPADVLLVAASRRCACGADDANTCRCTADALARHASRLDSALSEQFPIRVLLVPSDTLAGDVGTSSADIAERVDMARSISQLRGARCSAVLSHLESVAPLTRRADLALQKPLHAGALTPRELDGIRRVARTIADFDDPEALIDEQHVDEALALRFGAAHT